MRSFFTVPIHQAIRFLPMRELFRMLVQDFRRADGFDRLIAVVSSLVFALAFIYFPHKQGKERPFVPWDLRSTSEHYFDVFAAWLIIFLTGLALFYLRKKQRLFYGLMEISFSIALAYKWSWSLDRITNADWLAAGTIIYIIVRGLDNCSEAMAARCQLLSSKD